MTRQIGLDLAADQVGDAAGDGLGAADGLAFDRLDPGVQVLGDLQDLAAHGLQPLGALALGCVQLVADAADRLFDPVDARAGLGGVEPLHHLGAVELDLTRQGLGQLLEPGGVTRPLGLDPSLGRAHALVQLGEGALEGLQRLGGAALGLVQTRADLGQQVRADAGTCGLLDRLHALTQFRDARPLAFLDVVQAAGQGAQRLLDLAEGLLGLRAGVAFEGAQATMPLAQFLGDVVDAASLPLGLGVLTVQPAHQAGHGLVHALDGDGRAPLGGLQPGGDGVDGGADPLPAFVGSVIGVVETAAATATFEHLGAGGATRQGGVTLVLVFHDHGVQPFAQGHARAPRKILGDLAGLRINTLHAPRRRCAH